MGKCSVENCENECFEQEDKCILHCEKDDKNGWYTFGLDNKKEWNPEKVKLFWKEIRTIISNSQDRLSKFLPISFRNIVFPKFEGNGLYSNVLGYEDSFFEKEKEKKFTQIVNFSDCTFLDSVDLKNIQFEKDIVFSKCTLKDEMYFKKQQNIRISFLNCPEIESLNFSRIIFEQKVEIKDCVIKSCNFENTRFKKVCDFYKTEFHQNNFNKTTFEDIVVFTESKFHEDVNFKYTTFEKLALFRKTIFEKTVNFEDAIIKEEANFLEITSKEDKIEAIDVKNRETARIIKNSFEQQNNIIEANRFYALEMEKKSKELKILKNPLEWIVFKLHGISSNHSQNWLLTLFWIMIVSYLYILFSTKFNLIESFLYNLMIKKNLLNEIADLINPFSIMTSKDPITFELLLFKITIAYLIYQFIVSVRQNTRRK